MNMKLISILLLTTLIVLAGCSTQSNLDQAIKLAQNSECVKNGVLTEEIHYNQNTNTWWIDLELPKQGCDPACVVNLEKKIAEINWRCTGLIVD